MKICTHPVKAMLLLMAVLLPALAFSQKTTPRKGNIKPAGTYFIEMNMQDKLMICYLLDAQRQPLGTENITCRVKLLYPTEGQLEKELKPHDAEGFSTEPAPGFTTCEVIFNFRAEEISAKFDNPNPVVRQGQQRGISEP